MRFFCHILLKMYLYRYLNFNSWISLSSNLTSIQRHQWLSYCFEILKMSLKRHCYLLKIYNVLWICICMYNFNILPIIFTWVNIICFWLYVGQLYDIRHNYDMVNVCIWILSMIFSLRVTDRKNDKILKLDFGDSCTAMWVYLVQQYNSVQLGAGGWNIWLKFP